MSKWESIEGEPTCNNCGGDGLEPMHTDNGQYKCSWCSRCGCLNQTGTYRKHKMVYDDVDDGPMPLIHEFMDKNHMFPTGDKTPERQIAQMSVLREEYKEMQSSWDDWLEYVAGNGDVDTVGSVGYRLALAEELADLRVTIDLLAKMLMIDIELAERTKMNYNVRKSGSRDEDGKIVDDANIEKPSFDHCVW